MRGSWATIAGAKGDNGGTGPLMAALNRAVNHATQNGTLVVTAFTLPIQLKGDQLAISIPRKFNARNCRGRLARYISLTIKIFGFKLPSSSYSDLRT